MLAPPRILIVEDDPGVVHGLAKGLHQAGFETGIAMSGKDGIARILAEPFDLILLDLMLPGRSGYEVMTVVRTRVSVPIVVLSASTELNARLSSFESGAVDFVPKPFFLAELVARIRVRLALTHPTPRRVLTLADITLDLDARSAQRGEEDIGLTPHEFNVLVFLRERQGRALTRGQIADGALPETGERTDRTVDSHLSRIRKKVGPGAAALLQTVWGIGYRCAERS